MTLNRLPILYRFISSAKFFKLSSRKYLDITIIRKVVVEDSEVVFPTLKIEYLKICLSSAEIVLQFKLYIIT